MLPSPTKIFKTEVVQETMYQEFEEWLDQIGKDKDFSHYIKNVD